MPQVGEARRAYRTYVTKSENTDRKTQATTPIPFLDQLPKLHRATHSPVDKNDQLTVTGFIDRPQRRHFLVSNYELPKLECARLNFGSRDYHISKQPKVKT